MTQTELFLYFFSVFILCALHFLGHDLQITLSSTIFPFGLTKNYNLLSYIVKYFKGNGWLQGSRMAISFSISHICFSSVDSNLGQTFSMYVWCPEALDLILSAMWKAVCFYYIMAHLGSITLTNIVENF